MKRTIFISIVALFTGCASAKLLTPSQSDVDRVQSKFSNYTLAELNQGKALFEQHCGSCHGLKNPSSRTEERWRKIVPKMSEKVNKKEHNVLDANAQDKLLKYLITMSTAPKVK